MNAFTKLAIVLITLISFQSLSAKIYFGESANKIKKKGTEFTIKQIDSKNKFAVIQSQQVGMGKRMQQFSSPSGKYIVVYLTKKKKEIDELIIYSANNLEEVFRQNVGKISSSYLGIFVAPLFNQDESVIVLQFVQPKKKNVVNAYNIDTGLLLYSHPIDKKSILLGQSQTKQTIYIGGKPGMKGYSSIQVIGMENGNVLKTLSSKKTKYIPQSIFHPNLFVVRYINSKNPSYTLVYLDDSTGKVLFKHKTGRTIPSFARGNLNDSLYFTSAPAKGKGVYINKIVDDKVEIVAHSNRNVKPVNLIISNDDNRFLIASKSNIVLVDTVTQMQHKKIKTPFDVASGFFSTDSSLVYLREGTGSEVAIIDFNNQHIIKSSGTGRASVKFGQLLATVALGAATGYYTGYVSVLYSMSDTAMLLGRNQERLYVVNAKTNDVTLFNAKDLSNRKGIATGGGTFGVFQLTKEHHPDEKDGNVFVMSPNSISYFNHNSEAVIHKVEFDSLISFDFEENLLFTLDKSENVSIYRLSTGKFLDKIDVEQNINKISFF